MAEIIETTGKTVEDALSTALDKLGCGRAEVTYEVLREPSNGFLGLWGKRDAQIRVTTRPVIPPQRAETNIPAATVLPKGGGAAADEFPQRPKRFHTDLRSSARSKAEPAAAPVQSAERRRRSAQEEGRPARRYERERPAAYDENRPRRTSDLPLIPPSPEMTARAENFLRDIFAAMELTVSLRKTDTPVGVTYNMQGENLGILIGKHGQTLDALQYLTNLVVNKTPEIGYTRIILDVEDYRARREETLTRLAGHLADKACRLGEEIHLEPMSRHERKIIHMALQDNRRVTTYSAGDNPRRYVVIVPKRRRYSRGGYEGSSFDDSYEQYER